MEPERLRGIIQRAHDHRMHVVAWYLPSLSDLARDYRRAMRAIRFHTSDGDGFDSFALDIESPEVPDPTARTRRLLALCGNANPISFSLQVVLKKNLN